VSWRPCSEAPLERPVVPFYSALIGFVLFEAAYYYEIMRAGIQSVTRGQINAGLAIGLTYGQTMRYVVLPQAFRNMVPVLLTQGIILLQDTSLVYVVGLRDFLTTADTIVNIDNRPVELYTFAAVDCSPSSRFWTFPFASSVFPCGCGGRPQRRVTESTVAPQANPDYAPRVQFESGGCSVTL
jgi:hypothetical protein